ncbi:hypothetical protein [Companilactobacillus metriopterae]|uniref:hypothetical protein n=1 Tax=Companilactobacillus metriopterae TaxID=1909267 RepID=UPI00100BD487|nr:hypothetical protein [Companilactobacillus metriopterae]
MSKINILFRNFFRLTTRNYIFLTSLFVFFVAEFSLSTLFDLESEVQFALIILGMFIFSIINTTTFFKNDQIKNRYIKQKFSSYWLYSFVELLFLIVLNLFVALVVYFLSFIVSADFSFMLISVLGLFATGLVGSSIAWIFKFQWNASLVSKIFGQIGLIVVSFLALVNLDNFLKYIIPPVGQFVNLSLSKSSNAGFMGMLAHQIIFAIVLFLAGIQLNKNNFTK